jgi:hypothetical protein
MATATRSHGGERDVQISQVPDELLDPIRGAGGQREAVRDRHPPLHRKGAHPLEDKLEGERPQLAGLVEVDVDSGLVPLGKGEDRVQMLDRIPIQPAGVQPTDEGRATSQSGVEQLRRTAVADDAALRNATTWTLAREACASRAARTPSKRVSSESVST